MASTGAAELLSGFPGNLYYGLNHPRNESTFMKTESAMLFFTSASVTLSLSNVALDRYIAITSPLQYHNSMTLTRCLILIIFSWCLAFLSTSTAFMVSEENLVQMWIIESITFVLIPFCIKTFCYFRICQATKITFPVRENILETQLTKRRKHAAWENKEYFWNYHRTFYSSLYAKFHFQLYLFICGVTWLIMNEVKYNGFRWKIYFSYQRDLWPLGLRNKNAWFQDGFKINFPVYVPHYTPLIKRICREPRRT